MDSIKAFITEVITCKIINNFEGNYAYNDINLEETSEAYQRRLHALYESALMDVPFLAEEVKEGLVNIIDKHKESQSLFDAPDESVLESMNREIEKGNTNTSLKKERDFVKMVCDCVSLQKYYLNEFAMTIGYTPKEQEQSPIAPISVAGDDSNTSNEDANQEWVYGYEGIMSAFKWGRNKVAKFLKDSYYGEAIVKEGKKIALNVPKARELMQKKEQERKNPKRRRC